MIPKGYEIQDYDPTQPGWVWDRPPVTVDFKNAADTWDAPPWVSAGYFCPQVWLPWPIG